MSSRAQIAILIALIGALSADGTVIAVVADSLLRNAKQGINNMPPMGTCLDCTDAELQAAIRKMLP